MSGPQKARRQVTARMGRPVVVTTRGSYDILLEPIYLQPTSQAVGQGGRVYKVSDVDARALPVSGLRSTARPVSLKERRAATPSPVGELLVRLLQHALKKWRG